MSKNFYNKKDAEIVAGSANFSALINESPTTYGLVTGQATGFATLNSTLQTAWTASITPETRTSVVIEERNIAKQAVRKQAMLLSKIIYATPTVTDAQLMSLGLLPRPVYTPRPAVMTAPQLDVESVVGRLVTLRVKQAGMETNAKPNACAGANVYSFVGPTAPTDPDQYKYEGLATRSKFEVLLPNDVPSGATAFIAAAWISVRGQRGFACTPVQVTIQGGPVLAGESA